MALYDDLGGGPAIAAALDHFYPKVLTDPTLSPFFEGVDIEKLKVRVGQFFAMATGGPREYAGPTLRDGHATLVANGLDNAVFDAFVGLFGDVLGELGVGKNEVDQVLALLNGAREEVLNR